MKIVAQMKERAGRIRKVYQRAVVLPILSVELLWKEYDVWEHKQQKVRGCVCAPRVCGCVCFVCFFFFLGGGGVLGGVGGCGVVSKTQI